MNKPACLPLRALLFLFFFFPLILFGQLTDQQRIAINIYIESIPALAKYQTGLRDKILNDPGIISDIKGCWVHLKKYATLERCRRMDNLSTMYSELGQGVPELRNKFLPDFNREEYRNTMTVLPGNTLKIDATKHTQLLKHYDAGRKDKLNSENVFGSMIIQYPELIEALRKSANESLKKEVNDDLLNLWLEMNYYQKMRADAVKQIAEEEKGVLKILEGCLSSLPKKFEEELAKEESTPQKWTGIFGNENLTLKFEASGGFIFATSDKRLGSAMESSHWDLTVKGNKAEGTWIVLFNDNDKSIKRSGSIKVKLDGDIMTFEMLGEDWSIEWKEGVKPYETETAATTKGIKMDGTLKRKL